ncbi:MAG: alpha/beta fold hydrolase [Deltaproteobacteria bacterium]|nr:alpha/beta fold hydrolase [Deltaproteobacteria bacterium]
MGVQFLSKLFPIAGQPLVYTTLLNGSKFATQWTVYVGPLGDTGLHELEFLLEVDPVAMGQGGSLITQRCRLVCDESLRPVRYRTQTAGLGMSLEFKGETVDVTMPDGSKQTVPLGDGQFIMESNMTGQQALMLALGHAQGKLAGEAKFSAFVVNALMSVPYQMAPAPDLVGAGGKMYRSSHEEELLINDDGVLLVARTPSQAIEARREDPPPPLPAWHDKEVLPLVRLTYSPPAGKTFQLEDVAIPGPVTPLGATVTVPAGKGPFPAVLFLSGTGAHDRNGFAGEVDLGTHEIMDHLSEKGFVGLRYDTRGAGKTLIGKDVLEQGLETVITDARAVLTYLRGRADVDPNRIALIGHSQGGTVALAIAKDEGKKIAALVLMASPGRAIDDIVVDQIVDQGRKVGLSSNTVDSQIKQFKDYVELVRADKPWVAGQIPDHLFVGARGRRWFQEHLARRGDALVAAVQCPVLVAQGSQDFQVSPSKDAEHLVAAAKAAGVEVTYALLPDLDHTFKKVQGESTIAQYYDGSRHVDPSFLGTVTDWLRQRMS